MSHIFVNLSTIQDIQYICEKSAEGILESKEKFRNAISELDWNVKCEKDISVRAVRITYKLRSLNEALTSYSNFIDKAYSKYATLENYESKLESIGNVTPYSSSSVVAIVPPTNNSNESNDKKKKKWWEYIIDFGSKGLKLIEKYANVKVLNGSIAEILGLTVTIAGVFRKGINSAQEAVVAVTNILGKGITALSKIFKDKIPATLGATVLLVSDFVKLTTMKLDEVLQNAGGVIADIGNIFKLCFKNYLTDLLAALNNYSGETAKKIAGDIVKEVSDKVLAPLIAAGTMTTSLIGNVIEYSKDGFTLDEIGHILKKTGWSGAASLAKFYTCNLINIDVNKVDQYMDIAAWNTNEFWRNTNLPVWVQATGAVISSPVTAIIGAGFMLGDSIREIRDAFIPQ